LYLEVLPILSLFILQKNKTALPSFTANALRSAELTAEEKYALKFIAAALYGGGLDTVCTVSISSFRSRFNCYLIR
jgi:tripartite-type tricarboxylate transporter receptor subunit TctC